MEMEFWDGTQNQVISFDLMPTYGLRTEIGARFRSAVERFRWCFAREHPSIVMAFGTQKLDSSRLPTVATREENCSTLRSRPPSAAVTFQNVLHSCQTL